MAEELDGRPGEEHAEEHVGERERVEHRRARDDEHGPEDQRADDAEHQEPALPLGRHGERAHDHQEHEQVVDRQASLDYVAGEVLSTGVPSGDHREHDAEQHRDRDVEDRPHGGLAQPDRPRLAGRLPEVERDQPAEHGERHRPASCGRLEHFPVNRRRSGRSTNMGAATHSAAGPALEQSQDRCSEHLRGRS